jgi:D-beta-D-heptose 7-phosphate kinase/D-beta-D-heptose 1-phosphate adenosyltransferase
MVKIQSLIHSKMIPPEEKIRTEEDALDWRRRCREAGVKVVITNGCFDLLHRGHADYLSKARQEGDALLILMNSDSSVQALKGPNRPIIPEHDRAYMLAALHCIDTVLVFADADAVRLLAALQPDIYVKGGDYTVETINQDERRLLDSLGADIRFIPFVPGYSTTLLLDRIQSLG